MDIMYSPILYLIFIGKFGLTFCILGIYNLKPSSLLHLKASLRFLIQILGLIPYQYHIRNGFGFGCGSNVFNN
jgi:hypothetical protein